MVVPLETRSLLAACRLELPGRVLGPSCRRAGESEWHWVFRTPILSRLLELDSTWVDEETVEFRPPEGADPGLDDWRLRPFRSGPGVRLIGAIRAHLGVTVRVLNRRGRLVNIDDEKTLSGLRERWAESEESEQQFRCHMVAVGLPSRLIDRVFSEATTVSTG